SPFGSLSTRRTLRSDSQCASTKDKPEIRIPRRVSLFKKSRSDANCSYAARRRGIGTRLINRILRGRTRATSPRPADRIRAVKPSGVHLDRITALQCPSDLRQPPSQLARRRLCPWRSKRHPSREGDSPLQRDQNRRRT